MSSDTTEAVGPWEAGYDVGYEAGYHAALAGFRTEWGTTNPWGDHPIDNWSAGKTDDHATAVSIVSNLREAGHGAHVIWRGVTDWHKEES